MVSDYSSLVAPTSAVLGSDSVAVETWGTPLAVGAGSVSPAVLAVACHVVALVEDQVRVWVAVTVASLAGIADHDRVAVVPWSTPGWDNISACYNQWSLMILHAFLTSNATRLPSNKIELNFLVLAAAVSKMTSNKHCIFWRQMLPHAVKM